MGYKGAFMSTYPSLFISHGSPDIAIADTPARDFLQSFSKQENKPEAIILVSAHFEAGGVAIEADRLPQTVHDFGGFAPELYQINYPAPGNPALAERLAVLLRNAGLAAGLVHGHGFDHGAWVPLSLMYPEADIPVVMVSVDPHAGPQHHYDLGRAMAALRSENTQIIGSGSMTHNLQQAFAAMRCGERQAVMPEWVSQFVDWFDQEFAAGDTQTLIDYRQKAPHAVRNHPTEEHLMPLFAALGAAGENWTASKLHSSSDFGVLSMDAYAFD